ncbi:hypothetical protein D3C81_1695260 [compost metagenome]
MHVVADVSHHLRLQQVVHEGIACLFIRRIGRHRHHVEPHRRAFLGDRIADVHPIVCFFCTVFGLQDVAGKADRHTDVAVGQIAGVLRGMEVTHVWLHFHQQCFGFLVVLRVLAVVR